MTVGSGWLNRARRLLSELPDGPTHGYLAYMDGMLTVVEAGPPPTDAIARLEDLARRFGDPATGVALAGPVRCLGAAARR